MYLYEPTYRTDMAPEHKIAWLCNFRRYFNRYFECNPQSAIDMANAAFDEANRAEYERMPVSL